MKNKILKIILMTVCSLTVLCLSAFALYNILPYKVNKITKTNITYSKENSTVTVNANEIKILQITDLHVNGALDMPFTFAVIKKLVSKTQSDLIVVTGDIFSRGCSKKDVKRFVDFMEDLSIPYALTLGNHDDETPYSMLELSEILQNAKYSLFETGQVKDMYGNYFYNLQFRNGNWHQLIFMDSRSDGFTEESKDFYINAVNSTKRLNNGTPVKNFLFFHIPLIETIDAYNLFKQDASIGVGKIQEKICNQVTNVDFFNTVLSLNSTTALIYGHDHINNLKVKYKGVYFCYGLKSSTSSYNQKNMVGGTVINLKSDSSFTFEDVIIY